MLWWFRAVANSGNANSCPAAARGIISYDGPGSVGETTWTEVGRLAIVSNRPAAAAPTADVDATAQDGGMVEATLSSPAWRMAKNVASWRGFNRGSIRPTNS